MNRRVGRLLIRLRYLLASRRCPSCRQWAPRFSTGACVACGPIPPALVQAIREAWQEWEG